MKSISIVGCGWLGLEVAKYFLQNDFLVRGTTTTEQKISVLKSEGIDAYHLSIDREKLESNYSLPSSLIESDILLINVPPSRTDKELYKLQMEWLLRQIKTHQKEPKIIFVSSTSVYSDLNRVVVELDVRKIEEAARKDIFEAEEVWRTSDLDTTILRAGGLMGANRVAGKYFAGKKDLTTGNIPVNFIHRQDLVKIIYNIVTTSIYNRIFNVVCPSHPTRREVYLKNASEYGFEAPTFRNPLKTPDYKVVSCEALINFLNYRFDFPDPLEFA